MLAYYLDQTNSYTIRTDATASAEFTMSMQNMYTQENVTMSMESASFMAYENLFAFTGSIVSASVGDEWRMVLINKGDGDFIWSGTIQVYQSQSVDKAAYKTQNNQYVSHETKNEYVIM